MRLVSVARPPGRPSVIFIIIKPLMQLQPKSNSAPWTNEYHSLSATGCAWWVRKSSQNKLWVFGQAIPSNAEMACLSMAPCQNNNGGRFLSQAVLI